MGEEMSAFGKKLRQIEGGQVGFRCPGCNRMHIITVDPAYHSEGRPMWEFNGNGDAPTFTPSILVSWGQWEPPVTGENMDEWKRSPWPQTKVEKVCHSFVTDGHIQFLGDCTHALAGQTVDLPDFPIPREVPSDGP
jgi:hypothetical protein